jgi:branched-chain amino acid transport system permease protein
LAFLPEYWSQLVVTFAITAIGSLALYICFLGGLYSLGHAALIAMGAYTAGVLSIQFNAPLVVAVGASVLTGAALGLGMGLIATRLRGFYLAIATMAASIALLAVPTNLDSLGGANGLIGISIETTAANALLALVGVALVASWVRRSRFGRELVAIHADERLAIASGVVVWRHKLFAFVISGAVAGIAGALLAYNLAIVRPDGFGLSLSLSFWVTLIVGGTAYVIGPILGSALVVLVTEWFRDQLNIDQAFVYGGILIVMILVRPQGLLSNGDLRRVWEWLGRHRRKNRTATTARATD